MRGLSAVVFLGALSQGALGQVKVDLNVSPSAGIGSAGGAVVAPLSGVSLAPALTVSGLTAAPAFSPALAPAAPVPLAAPAVPAALALPAAAVPAAAAAPAALPAAPRAAGAGSNEASGRDEDVSSWQDGARLFDNRLDESGASSDPGAPVPAANAAPLSAWAAAVGRSPHAAEYAAAVRRASAAGWNSGAPEALDAAERLLSAQGVKSERIQVPTGSAALAGLRIVSERGHSPLNDLAYDVSRTLGAETVYVPERTRDSAAAFNGKQKLLMVANFDRPDFFLAALHEARHAWYSALLRRGDIRLFHLQAVAKPGRSVAPGAETYASYLSLEEVSTFPKTLKHMVTEQAKLGGDAARYLADRTATRAWQFLDILRSAASIAEQIQALDRKGRLEPRRMTDKEVAAMDLKESEAVDYFALDLWNQTLYVPVLRRQTRRFGVRRFRGSEKEAREALRLRAKLLLELAGSAAPATEEYLAAVRSGNLAGAGAAADRLIAAVRRSENAFPANPSKP